jgi:hypothetical protein
MYVRLDPRVSPLIHIVKAWARQPQVDLNDASRATFNSFSITLMILGYLQSIVPPVLPCIQASEGNPLSFRIPPCKIRRLTKTNGISVPMPDGRTFRPNWSWTAEMNLNPSARDSMAQVLRMCLKRRKTLALTRCRSTSLAGCSASGLPIP